MCHRAWVRAQTCSAVNKISFKVLVYTLCEDNLVPCLRYSFSDISLSVCLFTCVHMMFVACRCACESERVLWEEAEIPMIVIFLAPRWVCR